MKEYIERETAIELVKSLIDTMSVCTSIDECLGMKSMKSRALGALHDVPAADVVEVKHGRWEQKRVFDSKMVDQWQSAYCPVCHQYHTTPYLYYFSHYNYCPRCGAKMDGGADGE